MTADERPDTPDDLVLLAVWAYGDATLSVLQDPRDKNAYEVPQRVLVRLDDPARPPYVQVEVTMPSLATLGQIHRHAIAAAPGLAESLATEPPGPAA
jgi:hypothetical protein